MLMMGAVYVAPVFIMLLCRGDCCRTFPLNSKGMIFAIAENGKVACDLYEKNCCSEKDVIKLSNVTDFKYILNRSTAEQIIGGNAQGNNRFSRTFYIRFISFIITNLESDETVTTHEVELKHGVPDIDEPMVQIKKLVEAVKVMISSTRNIMRTTIAIPMSDVILAEVMYVSPSLSSSSDPPIAQCMDRNDDDGDDYCPPQEDIELVTAVPI